MDKKIVIIFLGLIFVGWGMYISAGKLIAGGVDKEITGNRGYLVGGSSGPKEIKNEPQEKHRGTIPEDIIEKGQSIIEQSREAKEKDSAVSEGAGIGRRGYLVGTPKEKIQAKERQRGRGGFVKGLDKAMSDLKEFKQKFKSKPYPADQSTEGVKGSYIYGEPPLDVPELPRELARTRGMKPTDVVPLIGRGIENLNKTWAIKPHRTTDKEIWGFRFPDMPKEEKKGITKNRGDAVKTIQSFINAAGADIEEHKASAPVDK